MNDDEDSDGDMYNLLGSTNIENPKMIEMLKVMDPSEVLLALRGEATNLKNMKNACLSELKRLQLEEKVLQRKLDVLERSSKKALPAISTTVTVPKRASRLQALLASSLEPQESEWG